MAKNNVQLKAEVREVKGKKVKNLRLQGWLPATVYGKGFEAVSVQANQKEFDKVFAEVGESGLVEIKIKDETWPVIFRNPQYHPVSGEMIHIDCYKVNLKEKIKTTVPLLFVGESQSVRAGNILVEVLQEVEVEALPADLPDRIEVDLSGLETLDSTITVADLKIEKDKVEIKNSADQVIVKTEEPKAEEAAPAAAETVAPSEVPATEQKTPEEAESGEKAEKAKEEGQRTNSK